MSDILEKCNKIMEFASKEKVDSFAKKQLGKQIKKYQSSVERKLADVIFKIDGKKYTSLLDALYKIMEWEEMEIQFLRPHTWERWEYDTPTKLIKINRHGKGGLMIFNINPFALNQWNPKQKPVIESAMFMSYLPYFYSPENIKTHSKKVDEKPLVTPRTLCSPSELWEDIRKKGIVPFQLTLCAYTKSRRYIYQLNVIDSALLRDFRDGKIPIANRIFRHPLEYNHIDKVLSTQELPDLAKKVLYVFYEMEDGDAADIEIGLGITEKMAKNNINALAKRGLIEAFGKPPRARYVINLAKIREMAEASE